MACVPVLSTDVSEADGGDAGVYLCDGRAEFVCELVREFGGADFGGGEGGRAAAEYEVSVGGRSAAGDGERRRGGV